MFFFARSFFSSLSLASFFACIFNSNWSLALETCSCTQAKCSIQHNFHFFLITIFHDSHCTLLRCMFLFSLSPASLSSLSRFLPSTHLFNSLSLSSRTFSFSRQTHVPTFFLLAFSLFSLITFNTREWEKQINERKKGRGKKNKSPCMVQFLCVRKSKVVNVIKCAFNVALFAIDAGDFAFFFYFYSSSPASTRHNWQDSGCSNRIHAEKIFMLEFVEITQSLKRWKRKVHENERRRLHKRRESSFESIWAYLQETSKKSFVLEQEIVFFLPSH